MGSSSSGSNPNAASPISGYNKRRPEKAAETGAADADAASPARGWQWQWHFTLGQARTGTQRRPPRMTRGFVHAETMSESATVSAPRQTVSAGGRTRRAGLTTWPPFTRHGCGRGHPGRQAGTRVRLARRVLPPPSPSLHTAAAPRRPVGVE